jgi:hypothetical protein
VKNSWEQTPFLEYQAAAGSLLKGRRAEDLDSRLGENDKGTHKILALFLGKWLKMTMEDGFRIFPQIGLL